ncbi:hypothetical protein [Verrucomicrobium sp. BvORR106]|uniref:hypothetical protein n=1 Tax=Verrucomicrobium sp. BvORR106 TaxID=1403819 RepID=UPI00224103CC|nr:hypothetical protein [Verrucomicrobium sp. BvORR106]
MKYYVLSHEYTVADLHDFPRFIGAFSTKAMVESALAEYRALPGFCDWSDGFHIDWRTVDNPSWSEGFLYPHPTGQIRASQSPRSSTFVAAPGEGEVGSSSPLTHPAPSSVYCLRHEYTDQTHASVFFIDLCSSREKAEDTVQQYQFLPGFRVWPNGFIIEEWPIDKPCWRAGFQHS